MKKDLFHECNDKGMTPPEFESMFCNQCKNRSCVRASWATSNWEDRISTQVDRLLTNPNIQQQQNSSRWDGIIDFSEYRENSDWKLNIETDALPNPIDPPKPTEPPQPIKPPILETPKKKVETPKKEVQKPKKEVNRYNTIAKPIMIGNTPQETPKVDDWSIPLPEVKIGGTFKMGS